MRTHTITRTIAGGVLLVMVGAGVACSKSASAFESPYCDTARQYAAHQLQHHGDGTPAAEKAESDTYMAFVDKGLRLAPKSLHSDWVRYHKGAVDETALMAKYGFDEARFNSTATDTEKTAMHEGDPKVQAAFENIIKYEAFKCGTGQPPDAKISFEGEKPGPFCDAVKEGDSRLDDVDVGDPAALRDLFTDPAKRKQAAEDDARLVATAPKVIKDDVKAEVEWWNTKQKPVQAKYGYDMAKLMLNGSAKELAAFQLTDKKIADHFARATAYEHQVCGNES